ncbi:MAG: DinB family protein [Acidobacteriaceae bacterium]|nr:DinB family protein [Acidobacteriaceae bacterium]
MVRRLGVMFTGVALFCCGAASAEQPAGVASEVKQAYESLKTNLIRTAEKVPDSDYSFKPTPDVRTFAEVMEHVISAQTRACGAITGDHKTAPANLNDKSAIVSALHDAFALCDKAYGSLTDANMTETIQTPRGQHTRLAALVGNTIHDAEQYGILSVYMRIKGIIPPSSEHSSSR